MAVIVISVGAPPELKTAIASILRQDVAVELVLVNSGGGDVRQWLPAGSDDVRIVESDTLWGPGTARNMGIEASRAPFVAFLAADCEAMDGWVRHRLHHHREGATAVASAVVNSHPFSLVSWASHLALFPNRFPGTPPEKAALYGGSYDRQLFSRHGMFEEIRIGEDTEFHKRIGKRNAPKWVPEVRTVHRNVTSIRQAWNDQHRRGVRSGKHWPQIHRGTVMSRVSRRLSKFFSVSQRSLSGRDRVLALASFPLLAANFLIFEKAANRGKANPDPVSSKDGKARNAMRAGEWKAALKLWRKSDSLEPGRFTPMLGKAECLMRLERYAAAEEAYAALRDAWPQLETGYLGIAAAAAKIGAFERELEAQQAIVRLTPGAAIPRLRVAASLLKLGRTDEAGEIASQLREEFPSIRGGFAIGAEVAIHDCQWQTAIAFYEHLVFEMNDWKSVPKWTILLVGLDRLDDARALWQRLTDAEAPPKARLHAAGPYLTACHRWDEQIALFAKFPKAVKSDVVLLRDHVAVLSQHGRLSDALSLIRRSELQPPELRSSLRASALFQADAVDEVLKHFRKLWKRNKITNLPVTLFSPILAAAIREEGLEFAGSLLERLVDGARSTRHEVLWAFRAVFHRERLRWLNAIFQSSLPSPQEKPFESSVIEIAEAQTDGRQSALLVDTCRRWQESRHRHPAFFPDPSFVLSDALAVADRIANAIDSKQPFSLVRLGDGEGNLLPYRKEYSDFSLIDPQVVGRTWWADDALEESADEHRRLLQEAILAADVVGIPDLHRVCRVIGIDRSRELISLGKNSRGMLAVLDFAATLPPDRLITSCHIHEALNYWGLWELLISRAKRVSLITCHPKLGETLTELHGVEIGEVHLIPPEQKYSASFQNSETERHYPDTFLKLEKKLASVPPGEVFLVAAGVLGKTYCRWIKEAGGIGLDIGSTADFWCGFVTRGLDEQSAYLGPDWMADRLRSLASSDERIARLVDQK